MFNRLFRRKPKPPLEETLRLAQGSEAMYRKALEHNEALGNKEGMAINYANLGILYKARGDLEQAEAMFSKALEIDKAMGRKAP